MECGPILLYQVAAKFVAVRCLICARASPVGAGRGDLREVKDRGEGIIWNEAGVSGSDNTLIV